MVDAAAHPGAQAGQRSRRGALARAVAALVLVAAAHQTGRAADAPAKAPVRRHTEVSLPLLTPVPAELVPVKPGTSEKVPAHLEAVLSVGPLEPVSAVCFSPD